MIDKEQILKVFITNFIQKDKRERCSFELTNPKKRNKFVDRLNHKWESVLDMRLLTKVEKDQDYSEKIKQLLKFKDDELCYVISSYEEYDDKVIPFTEVFKEIYARGFATLLINTSADTLFLDTEQEQGHTPRFIGKRKQGE